MIRCLSVLIAILMFFVFVPNTFAQNINDVLLKYEKQASYEIIIPPEINIDASTRKGSIIIQISEASLEPNTEISLLVTSDNYDNGWWLVNKNGKVSYTLGTTNEETNIKNGEKILVSNKNTEMTIYINVEKTTYSGYFSDTLTFVTKIEEIS